MSDEAITSTARVREALRTVHTVAPEAAAIVESHIDALERQVQLLGSDDAFRAFVIEQAREAGATKEVLTRLDSTVLASLAQAEADRAAADLIRAQKDNARAVTTRELFSQPVVLAAITALSGLGATLLAIVAHLLGVGTGD